MTDPATLSPSALGEAVMRALGWEKVTERYWLAVDEQLPALDFHGPDRWDAFGVVVEAVDSAGGSVEVRSRVDEVGPWNEVSVWIPREREAIDRWAREDADAPGEIPAALAVAFLRARAGEGR